jgi:hypothetical protein
MNRIDDLVHQIRRAISEVAQEFDSTTQDLIDFVAVDDDRAYNSLIDSFYLLEDTQLAKHAFLKESLATNNFGRLYLLYYGVLNACYMQQQALLVLCEKLGIKKNIEAIKNSELVQYRNDFSAHSSNRGRGKAEHSYILDRHALQNGKLEGFSSNHMEGDVFRNASIFQLLEEWDRVLESQMKIVSKRILGSKAK